MFFRIFDFFNFSEKTNQKNVAVINMNVHQKPYFIHINILFIDVWLTKYDNQTETIIRTTNVIITCFRRFQYSLKDFNQEIRVIINNNNHNHSRNNAGNDDENSCNQ